MCFRVQCNKCGLATYGGCGRHAAAVMANIPQHERCRCGRGSFSPPPPSFPVAQKAYGRRETSQESQQQPIKPVPPKKAEQPVLPTIKETPKKKDEALQNPEMTKNQKKIPETKIQKAQKVREEEPKKREEFRISTPKKVSEPIISKPKEQMVNNYKEEMYEEIKKVNEGKFSKPTEELRKNQIYQGHGYSLPLKNNHEPILAAKTNEPMLSTRDRINQIHQQYKQKESPSISLAAKNILNGPSYKSNSLNKPALRLRKAHNQIPYDNFRNMNHLSARHRAALLFSRPNKWA